MKHPHDPIHLDGSFVGTSGNNTLNGTSNADAFDISQGGNDTVNGKDGSDYIYAGAAFTAADTINGGDGDDVLELNGNYGSGLTLKASTLSSVETIMLDAGHNYDLTVNADDNARAGMPYVDASALGSHNSLTFHAGTDTGADWIVAGGAGDDVIVGASSVGLYLGGDDTVTETAANGEIVVDGPALTAADRITGFGRTTLNMYGECDVTFGAKTATHITTFLLQGNSDFRLTLADTTVSSANFNVDLSNLRSGSTLRLNDMAETTSAMHLITPLHKTESLDLVVAAGGGDDVMTLTCPGTYTLSGNGGKDQFTFARGANGVAHINGGGGQDTIIFGDSAHYLATFSTNDTINGGSGNDTLEIHGTDADFLPGTIKHIENLVLTGGTFTMDDANVAAGATLNVTLQGNFDGSAETDGAFHIVGGKNVMTGSGDDFIRSASVVSAGAGNDQISGPLSSSFVSVDGGSGNDSLELTQTDGAPAVLTSSSLVSVETLKLNVDLNGWNITFNDGNVAALQTLLIDASANTSVLAKVKLDGSAETNGSYHMIGGVAADHLTGGARADTLNGGAGADVLIGGLGKDRLIGNDGADHFVYASAAESTSTGFDTIVRLGQGNDKFDLPGAVTGLDTTIAHGALSNGTFDADLAAAAKPARLAADHAVLFTPDSGDHAGQTFLIVDANGTAGYQANQDFVFLLSDPHDLSGLAHMFG